MGIRDCRFVQGHVSLRGFRKEGGIVGQGGKGEVSQVEEEEGQVGEQDEGEDDIAAERQHVCCMELYRVKKEWTTRCQSKGEKNCGKSRR